jgi:hypothetical protein
MSDQSFTDTIELADLPLFWQGRANALGLLNERRVEPDARTVGLIETYEECAKELRAALSRGAAKASRIEQLEAALWVFIGVLRAPSSYINDAYELHVKRLEYEKACTALAPRQDK